MRRVMFLVLSAAIVAVSAAASAQQATPQARPTTPPQPSEPAAAAPVGVPPGGFAPTMAPMPGQEVTPPPPPQRGGRGAAPGALSGQQGGRGRGSMNGAPAAPAVGRGDYFVNGPMQNIKIEVVLSDSVSQSGGKKTVSMVVTNNRKGQIRAQGNSSYTINVDAQPQLLTDGRILVALDLLYLPETTGETKPAAIINESLSVVVNPGTPMQVSQSADPRSDRKVTVELTASILK